jgi:hypothetical protein
MFILNHYYQGMLIITEKNAAKVQTGGSITTIRVFFRIIVGLLAATSAEKPPERGIPYSIIDRFSNICAQI